MKKLIFIFLIMFTLVQDIIFAQTEDKEKLKRQILSKTDTIALSQIGQQNLMQMKREKEDAVKFMESKGYLIKKSFPDGSGVEFMGFKNGLPIYYSTHNRYAAATVSTDKVRGGYGFSLDGTGITIGVWDEGSPYIFHNSFREGNYGPNHVFYIDSTGSSDPTKGLISDHTTHVVGTLVADDDDYWTKGMAQKSVVNAFDWNWDLLEMANAASGLNQNFTEPLVLSNHSYGANLGWVYGDYRKSGTPAWYWFGDPSAYDDIRFGRYDDKEKTIDSIAFSAPYYTIVRSAGNSRGKGIEYGGHYDVINRSWTYSTNIHRINGGSTGYNCMSQEATPKNILTIGAVDDIYNGYNQPTDVKQDSTSFSAWGPTTDGRIKRECKILCVNGK